MAGQGWIPDTFPSSCGYWSAMTQHSGAQLANVPGSLFLWALLCGARLPVVGVSHSAICLNRCPTGTLVRWWHYWDSARPTRHTRSCTPFGQWGCVFWEPHLVRGKGGVVGGIGAPGPLLCLGLFLLFLFCRLFFSLPVFFVCLRLVSTRQPLLCLTCACVAYAGLDTGGRAQLDPI